MRSPPSNTRLLFFSVLTAIVAVYLVGRFWMQRSGPSGSTEAGFLSQVGSPDLPAAPATSSATPAD